MILRIAFLVGRMQGGAFLVGHLLCPHVQATHSTHLHNPPAQQAVSVILQMVSQTHWARSLARDTQLA